VRLQVRGAYYRALLARELESISQAALVQAESFLDQERLRERAGYASELDVLRAEVSLENLRPQLVAAQNARQLADLNLKRLVNVPFATALRLTTPLEIPSSVELGRESLDPDVNTRLLSTVAASELQTRAQAQNVRIARAARLPAIGVQMAYGGQVFPQDVVGFSGANWQPDWTATLNLQLPVFTGFETQAAIGLAQIAVRQSELQLAQVREAVTLEYEQALGEKARARVSIGARQRTVEQAQRVYDLTVLRYGQGQATQLEVSQARLDLLQARSNLAQAIADFYVADAGLSTIAAPSANDGTLTP
jgi:outer membrane protein TolC